MADCWWTKTRAAACAGSGLLAARQAAQGALLLVLDDVRPQWVEGARSLQQARPRGTALRLAAEKLLLELAPDRLTPAEAAEMAKLCGCWPLALRLAGALAAVEGADWLLPRLRDERRRLAALQLPGAGGKEESVALAFDLSYEWLAGTDGAAARAFRWLAAFAPAPVEAERLAAVLVWGELPAAEQARRLAQMEQWRISEAGWAAAAEQVEAVEETLQRLRRAALLQMAAPPLGATMGTSWYTLHPLLRDYAGARLVVAGERAAAEDAHRGVHLAYARANRDADPAAYDALERADVLLALDRAYAAQAWALGDPASGYLAVRGYWGELRKRLEQAVAAAKAEGDKREVAAFVHNLAIVAQNTGEMETARQRYAESLAIERELGNRAGMAITLGQLANLERNEGNEAEAERLYREAIEIGRQVGDVAGMSIRMFNLGLLLEKQARLAEAMPLLQQSVDIAERIQFYEAKRWRGVLERVQQKLADHGGAA